MEELEHQISLFKINDLIGFRCYWCEVWNIIYNPLVHASESEHDRIIWTCVCSNNHPYPYKCPPIILLSYKL